MPYLRVEVGGRVTDDQRRQLLSRTAALFADIVASPVERMRTQVVELGDGFAVGGVPITESGDQAPLIWIELMEGRPPDRHLALIEGQTALVASILDIPTDRVRVRITEIPPALWGIAGRPASEARAGEIAARAAALDDRGKP